MSASGDRVVIEAALNGGRTRREHPRVPQTPAEVAAEARRCADAGASVVHIHARRAGGWSADRRWYAEAHRRIRDLVPGMLISVTSIRPEGVVVSIVLELLAALVANLATRPDLLSINLGHITTWEPPSVSGVGGRRTVHFPNDCEDIAALLAACRDVGITPELGVMDLGFVSNAVALREDRLLPPREWFLIELDSPAYGAGKQVAPSTPANYTLLASLVREYFPRAAWAAHGVGLAGYDVLRRALEDGAHVRVGFEDVLQLPDGRRASSNADLVEWAVGAAKVLGREPATAAEAQAIIAGSAER